MPVHETERLDSLAAMGAPNSIISEDDFQNCLPSIKERFCAFKTIAKIRVKTIVFKAREDLEDDRSYERAYLADHFGCYQIVNHVAEFCKIRRNRFGVETTPSVRKQLPCDETNSVSLPETKQVESC